MYRGSEDSVRARGMKEPPPKRRGMIMMMLAAFVLFFASFTAAASDEDGRIADTPLGASVNITVNATNMTHNAPATISTGTTLTFNLTPDAGYHRPAAITVTVNGIEVQPPTYTYTVSSGGVYMPVTTPGDIVITAVGEINTYKVSFSGTNLMNTAFIVDHGSTVETTLIPKDGYVLPKTVRVYMGPELKAGQFTYDRDTGLVTIPNVTAAVDIYASGLRICSVTVDVDNMIYSGPATAIEGDPISIKLTPASGNIRPSALSVTMNGKVLTSYSYTMSTGTLLLTVTGDIVVATADSYAVSVSATNMTHNAGFSAPHGAELQITIMPKDGYTWPKTVHVMMGSVVLTAGTQYTYDSNTGVITIPKVMSNLSISVTGAKLYSITVNAENMTHNAPEFIAHGENLSVTLVPDAAYNRPASVIVTMNGVKLTSADYLYSISTGTILKSGITGDVVITAEPIQVIFSVTSGTSFITHNAPGTIPRAETLTFTLTPIEGYKLPGTIDLTMKGAPSPSYSYDPATGAVTVPNVTGDIYFSAAGVRIMHQITINTTYVTAPSGYYIYHGDPLTRTFEPFYGYSLPSSLMVTMGGVPLTADEYTYDSATGAFRMDAVTAPVTITIAGVWNHTVTFDPNNGSDTWTVKVPKGSLVAKPADPEMFGWSFIGWFDTSGVLWTFGNNVADDITLRAKWSENQDERFRVTFDPNNGNPKWTVSVVKGSPAAMPEPPSWRGYTFEGWFDGETPWAFQAAPERDVELVAKWSENMNDRWNVIFDPANGDQEWTVSVIKGSAVIKPDTPMKKGYTFLGWFVGDAPWAFADAVQNDMTLKAKWAENPDDMWTVTFDPNDGGQKWIATVPKDSPAEEPKAPERYGWSFLGWYLGNDIWDFEDNVTDNIRLTAKWAEDMNERWNVTFDPNNGDDVTVVSVPKGTPVRSIADPIRYGWTFIGWYDGDGIWDFKKGITEEKILMAEWIENEEERWTISFDPNNGEGEWYMTVPKGAMAAKPADPKMYGWTFFGWFDPSGVLWTFENCVTGDLHLRAKWAEESGDRWIVTFDTNKGGQSWSVSVPKGGKVACPDIPFRYGWDFGGWFLGDAQWDFEGGVNDNMTLTAKWIAPADHEDDGGLEIVSTALTLLAAFILIMTLIRKPKVTGIVSQNGKGLGDVEIRYSVDGTEAAVVTDSFGRYVIPVSIGSEIEIVSVDGRGLTRDFSVKVQKKLTEVNIRV